MIVLTYEIELLEPCLVTSLQGDPNSAISFDYLPGAVLRGALIDRYIWQQREGNKQYQLEVEDAAVQALFFNGSTRYLNAYPVYNKQRTLPTPLSWQVEKHEEGKTIYDFAAEDAGELYPDKDWKGVKKPFAIANDDEAIPVDVERYMAIHIARDRHPNRNEDREPARAVYRYDALAAGQTFAAAIFCPDKAAADVLAALLPDVLSLGGSRSGGYGRVSVKNIQAHQQWRQLPGKLEGNGDLLTITLLSDTLIRNENGQFVAQETAFTQHLENRLRCSLELKEAYYQTTAVGGFNRKWGLPLPQAAALSMGSVFVYQVEDHVPDTWQELENSGIGERRLDGFGSVGVNWHREPELSQREPETKSFGTTITLNPDTPSARVAQDIADRIFRQKLNQLLDEQANAIGQAIRGMNKTQLHAIRQVAYKALLQDPQIGQESLATYLSRALDRRVSRDQLENARVEGQKMSIWLQNRVKDMQVEVEEEEKREIWQKYLRVTTLPQIGGIQAKRTSQMAYEYNMRLIAAVLASAAKVTSGGTKNG